VSATHVHVGAFAARATWCLHPLYATSAPLRRRSRRPQTSQMNDRHLHLAVYDLETTTGSEKNILEIAVRVVHMETTRTLEKFHSLVRARGIDAYSEGINGITNDMVRDAPTFEAIAARVHAVLDGRVWCGHNVRMFDNVVLLRHFKQLRIAPPRAAACLDTLELSRTLERLARGRVASWPTRHSLAHLCAFHGIRNSAAHRARGDVDATLQVLAKCANAFRLSLVGALFVANEGRFEEEEPGAVVSVTLREACSTTRSGSGGVLPPRERHSRSPSPP
jgi:DNA polymerase III epsilon subunit-like protein